MGCMGMDYLIVFVGWGSRWGEGSRRGEAPCGIVSNEKFVAFFIL